MATEYERGKTDGLRFAEFRTYERIATFGDGRTAYVAGPISRLYCEGLRDAGCRVR
jgi:hypothetical protein